MTPSQVADWINQHPDQFSVYYEQRYGSHVTMFPLATIKAQYVPECDGIILTTKMHKPPQPQCSKCPGVHGEDAIKEH